MSILQFLFGSTGGESPGTPDSCNRCERVEQRRTNAVRAYSEEHLFGYIDTEGNVSDTPPERNMNGH